MSMNIRPFRAFLAIVVVWAGVTLAVAPMLTGCGTPAAKTTQVAGTVTITVDAAMQSWGAWVRAGKATVGQRVQVRTAYQKYQASMLVAEKIAVSVLSAPEQQSNYVTALNAAAQASMELIALVEALSK